DRQQGALGDERPHLLALLAGPPERTRGEGRPLHTDPPHRMRVEKTGLEGGFTAPSGSFQRGRLDLQRPDRSWSHLPETYSSSSGLVGAGTLLGRARHEVGVAANPHRLDVHELADSDGPELAPVAGLLDSTERKPWIGRHHSVHE